MQIKETKDERETWSGGGLDGGGLGTEREGAVASGGGRVETEGAWRGLGRVEEEEGDGVRGESGHNRSRRLGDSDSYLGRDSH